MSTEAEVGYADAMRQLHRNLERRLKVLMDALHGADEDTRKENEIRISEIQHMIDVVESLHR